MSKCVDWMFADFAFKTLAQVGVLQMLYKQEALLLS